MTTRVVIYRWDVPLPWKWVLLFHKLISDLVNLPRYAGVCFGSSNSAILGSIQSDYKVNVASDFIAQYTTRQKYRFSERFPVDNALELRIPGSNGLYLPVSFLYFSFIFLRLRFPI